VIDMRSWKHRQVGCWLLALAAGCQPAAEHGPAEGHTGGEARGTPVPQRPRFQHLPRAYSSAKVHAARIELAFADARGSVQAAKPNVPAMALPADGETLEVALPAGYEALVRERLDRLVSDSGPVVTFRLEVKTLTAERTGDVRRLDIDLAITVEDESGRPLVRGSGNGNKELLGPPYDDAELDDLHRAACLDALDVFLASEGNIELINQNLGEDGDSPGSQH